MKKRALFIFILFASFLVTPAIVSVLKHVDNMSSVFNMSEEETKHVLKKNRQSNYVLEEPFFFDLLESAIKKSTFDFYLLKEMPGYTSIFSPPPDAAVLA